MPKYKVFAAIDLGSTAISMKIAEISKNDGVSVIDSVRYNTDLGSEVYRCGKISYNMVETICSCLEGYVRIMEGYGVEDYTCYATTALREAVNSEYVIDQINIRCNLKVNIISNEEERFLHNKAFALNNEYFDDIISEGAVIVDVTSGSTQISSYENSELRYSQSIPMGSLRAMEIVSGVKNNTVEFTGLLEEYVKTNIDSYKRSFFKNTSYKYFVLFGAQMSIIKKICKIEGTDHITAKQLNEIYNLLNERTPESISDEYNISYEDAQLLLPSVLIYKNFIDNTDEKVIVIPDISLVDGIMVEYLEKNKYTHTKHIFTNDIISSAFYYADKYGIDRNYCYKIIDFSTEIFRCMSKKFGLSKKDLNLLKVAAIFADTGRYININNYNRYSYDITKANPILGVPQKDNEIISYTVLFQDNVFDYYTFNTLPKNRKLLISKLSAILSLAKSLDVEYNHKIKEIKASLKNGELIINAYSEEDITFEKWQFEISEKFFEEVFGIKSRLNKVGVKK